MYVKIHDMGDASENAARWYFIKRDGRRGSRDVVSANAVGAVIEVGCQSREPA
jgi:hypothetical protein